MRTSGCASCSLLSDVMIRWRSVDVRLQQAVDEHLLRERRADADEYRRQLAFEV